MQRRVAVIVVTYNSEVLLPDLVGSLPEPTEEVVCELVVADNASSDRTVARLRSIAPDAAVVEMERNAGYAAGINAAVGAAGPADAYLVLNPDVRLTSGCLDVLLGALDHPEVGIAVPRLLDREGRLILSRRREPSLLRALGDLVLGAERAGRWASLGEMVSSPEAYDEAGPTDWAEGSTQLISADCWEACGRWDERFFLYSEEAEYDLRAGDRGWLTWFEPLATAVHLEGGSARDPALWALVQTNRVRLYRQRHGPVSSTLFWLTTVAREASRAILGRSVSHAALMALLSRRRLTEQPGPHTLRRRVRQQEE